LIVYLELKVKKAHACDSRGYNLVLLPAVEASGTVLKGEPSQTPAVKP